VRREPAVQTPGEADGGKREEGAGGGKKRQAHDICQSQSA